MQRFTHATLIGIIAAGLLLTGCTDPANETDDTETDAPTDTTTDTSSSSALPIDLFAATAPEGAVALLDAKTTAKAGDRVVFEARVGGRETPFIDDRAVFFVADAALESCDQMEGDTCKTPWDYCCEPQDNLLANMATVQVVDDAGRPLKLSLRSQHGLEPLKTIVVSGVVAEIDEGGTFVVNAETIHVRER